MTGEQLVSVNPDLSVIPASTMKIVTTGAALNILGKDFRYETLLQYSGNIDANGVLHGNIYIKGSGDPTFGSPHIYGNESIEEIFNHWLDSVKVSGIKEINGQIIADESIFDNELVPREWTWEDVGNYYGAGSSGLAQKNRITTRQLAEMLIMLAECPQAGPFLESLAVAGRTGTLSHLFNGRLSQDILVAKSGFLSNVIAYAGYTSTKNNDFIVFALIVNNYEGNTRSMRNKMIKLLDNISNMD